VAVAIRDEEGRVQPRQIHSRVTRSSMSEYALTMPPPFLERWGPAPVQYHRSFVRLECKSMHDSSSHFAIRQCHSNSIPLACGLPSFAQNLVLFEPSFRARIRLASHLVQHECSPSGGGKKIQDVWWAPLFTTVRYKNNSTVLAQRWYNHVLGGPKQIPSILPAKGAGPDA
jgi:hypothetical protein